MRLFGLLGLLLCVGCAGMSSGVIGVPDGEAVPTEEHVYLLPLDQAMLATRYVFEDLRFSVFERGAKDGGIELFTSAYEPAPGSHATVRFFERYYVKGVRVGPRQTIVRVFRLVYNSIEGAVEQTPKEMGKQEEEDYLASKKGMFDREPFEGAPTLEGFRFMRGVRDLKIERLLLAKLEMMPALEVVGQASPAPVRSIVVDEEDGGAQAQAPSAECGAPLAGAESLAAKGLTLLVADPLGTRELPTAALQLLCEAAKGGPVALGLSIPASEQLLLDEYLASAGQSKDVQQVLMRGTFWRRTYQDGRSSRSILWLIEQARRLRASGRDVSLVAFDSTGASGTAREEEMAKHLLAFRKKHPEAWLLVLAGDVHVRTGNVDWDSDFVPMGARLAKELPSVRALDVGFARGSQFACRANVFDEVDCNLYGLSPTDEVKQAQGVANGVQLFAQPSPAGFHGRLYVGAVSASPPALRPTATAARPSAEAAQAN